MSTEFIRVTTSDGRRLEGLLTAGSGIQRKDQKVVVHLHGLAGNFYENPIVDSLREKLTENGCAFLQVNTRGHDYLADVFVEDEHGGRWVAGGGAHERFAESISDIRAWLSFSDDSGFGQAVLQGHSYGACKALNYIATRPAEEWPIQIGGLILASAPDVKALHRAEHPDASDALIELAQEMVDRGDEVKLMPDHAMEGYLVDAGSFLEMYGPSAIADLFDFEGAGTVRLMAEVDLPLLAFYGTEGEAVTLPPNECLKMLAASAPRSTRVQTQIIQGAPHSYLGFEDQVADLVTEFVNGL